MKVLLKKLLPKTTWTKLADLNKKKRLLKNYYDDYTIYANNSGFLKDRINQESHGSELINYYHRIEKGLSLKTPKIGFGKEVVNFLVDSLNDYVKKYNWDDVSITTYNVLLKYYEYNSKHIDLNWLIKTLNEFNKTVPVTSISPDSGAKDITKNSILKATSAIDFKEFTSTRYSIRNYTDEEVSMDLIKSAIKIAQKTPSVCNRQTSRVHIFASDDMKIKALSLQNGNLGFGDKASKIIMVTSDIQGLFIIPERNQAYIDGGMFAMSLIYALHSLGVGTCPLNLAVESSKAKEIREKLSLRQSELLITMISVGHIPDELKVAASARKEIEEIIKVHV